MFNDVLAMEYLMKNRKYSNADHILVPWMKITLMFFGLFISFLDTLYDIVTSTHDSDKIHRVQRNDYSQNTFKYPTSNIICRYVIFTKVILIIYQVPAMYKILAFFIWQSAGPFVVYHYTSAFQTFAKNIMKNFVEDLEQVFFCKKCKNKEKVNYNRQPKTFIIDIPTKMTKTTETDSEDNSIRIGKEKQKNYG